MEIPVERKPLSETFKIAPKGFSEIERCYFDGATFVETNFKKSNLRDFEIECEFMPYGIGSRPAIFGANASSRLSITFRTNDKSCEFAFGNFYSGNLYECLAVGERHSASYRKNGTTLYGQVNDVKGIWTVASSLYMDCPLYIGARGGNLDRYFDGYFYEMRIFCADDNSKYFIYPVRNLKNGEVFLYEQISKTILQTKQGRLREGI